MLRTCHDAFHVQLLIKNHLMLTQMQGIFRFYRNWKFHGPYAMRFSGAAPLGMESVVCLASASEAGWPCQLSCCSQGAGRLSDCQCQILL